MLSWKPSTAPLFWKPCAPAPAGSVAASASCACDQLARNSRDFEGDSDEGVLRQGRGPQPDQGQDGRDRRLRLAGPCPRTEPQRQRRQGRGRPAPRRRLVAEGREGGPEGGRSRRGGEEI